ncbi:valine--tRNA ligase [bacterium]|jgi:valyl-tRNA synthetase|nr:valine--tRNA ligase [bacterium]
MEKRYDYQILDKKSQKFWEEKGTYSHKKNGPIFSIDTPPPTVSGAIHIGHICSYTQTDIIARYKRMCGLSVFYPFGFDDNGLPTERYVEKKQKTKGHLLPRSEFIKKCLEETKLVEKEFECLWKAIGLSADWDYCYSTISDDVRKLSQESFIRLYKQNCIYRKNEPAPYCTTCRTSVAQAELEDQEKKTLFSNIAFADKSGNQLVIATTRPELLASCVALFYHPSDKRYSNLKENVAIVPLFNQEIPILADEKVDIEKGTGLVMCCTFGDKTDIEWYKKHNLKCIQSIDKAGKLLESVPFIGGLKTIEARKKILEILQDKNLVLEQQPISHSVNIHERCKQDIEFIELPQWFIKILDSKDDFLKAADKITWHPEFMKSRYKNWVENLQWDWCISRQRFYGIPFPVWYCENCQEVLLPDINQLPIDPQESCYPGKICPKCNENKITPDTDIMDTWNTSSITPQICNMLYTKNSTKVFEVSDALEFIPMSYRPQAHDIIRTWAFYTIVKSWMHFKTIPWKTIAISGHVLSPKKEKISKSLNNNPLSPKNLLDRYPADTIRFWTATGTLGQDTAFSENQFKIGNRLVTKLWNAFRFLKEHIQGADLDNKDFKNLGVVNEWIMQASSECFVTYEQYLEKNEFSLALNSIEHFFWKDFCDNYLEVIKDQLFNPENYKPEQIKATLKTLSHIGLRILQMYAPYLPHVTEELYQIVYKDSVGVDSVHQTTFEGVQIKHKFEQSFNAMKNILYAIGRVRKIKTEQQLSLKTELEELTICSEEKNVISDIQNEEALVKGITKAKKITYKNKCEKCTIEKEGDTMRACINMEDSDD